MLSRYIIYSYLNQIYNYFYILINNKIVYIVDDGNLIQNKIFNLFVPIFFNLYYYSYIYKLNNKYSLIEYENKKIICPIIEKIIFINEFKIFYNNINKKYSNNFYLYQVLHIEKLNNYTELIIEKYDNNYELVTKNIKINQNLNKRLYELYNF